MDIETSNAIKLFFPSPSLVQLFFEAVANSLDAGASQIAINIGLQGFTSPDTLEISITDNGAGFTNDNFARFKTLLKRRDEFHKGLGRLVYLNYFNQVEVISTWDNSRRSFIFKDSFDGKAPVETLPQPGPNSTCLTFRDFAGGRVRSYEDLKPGSLRERLIGEFLPTLHERRRVNTDFKITIDLITEEANEQKEFFSSGETITPADLPELISVEIKDPLVDAYEGVKMYYRVKSGMGERTLLTAVSIDGRTIPIKLLQSGALPPDHSAIFLFSSKLFAGASDTSRQKLILPVSVSEPDLLRVLRREVSKVLAGRIPQIAEKNTHTKQQFEEKFPHLFGYFEETTVGLIDKDEALEIAQRKFFKAEKEVLQCDRLDEATFEKSIELSSRTLTEYILYRELIIKRLRELSGIDLEATVHDLIVPRGSRLRGEEVIDSLYHNNAWLLDDKFMSFRVILSEAEMKNVVAAITLSPVEDSAGETRPDISMVFSADPASADKVDVVIVEVKRKRDNDKENTFAAVQLLQRARKLIDFCPNIQRAWYFGIIKINDELEQFLRDDEWTPLYSKGKVFYRDRTLERPGKPPVPVPLCLISFDAIVEDAAARNHTFLEILRSEIKRSAKPVAFGDDSSK